MRLPIRCPSREEMLAAELPIEVVGVSRTPEGKESPVIYRHPTPEAALVFGRAESEAMGRPITPCPACGTVWCWCRL